MNILKELATTTANGLSKVGTSFQNGIQLMANAGDSLDGFTAKFKELLNVFLPWVWGILGSVMVVWGIFIGVKFMLAKKAEQRVEAKDYIKNFIIGIVLCGVVGVLGTFLIPAISSWAGTTIK